MKKRKNGTFPPSYKTKELKFLRRNRFFNFAQKNPKTKFHNQANFNPLVT